MFLGKHLLSYKLVLTIALTFRENPGLGNPPKLHLVIFFQIGAIKSIPHLILAANFCNVTMEIQTAITGLL